MFCCAKPGQANVPEESNQVERELEIQNLKDKLKFKILLLGAGESGKSTVLKQIKLINKISLQPDEIKQCADSLKTNAIESMQLLIDQAAVFQYTFSDDDQKRSSAISLLDPTNPTLINLEVADHIVALWKSEVIQKTYSRRKGNYNMKVQLLIIHLEFWILDSVDFFFENITRFVEEDFVPTEEDLVMARVMTTGIITTDIPSSPVQFVVVDVGGQRNERRKWIHCFDDVSGIVFIVNLAGYNSVLFEDRSMNRMEESFILFKQMVNNPSFAETPFYLVFNKKDLFEKLIRDDPLSSCNIFSDYQSSLQPGSNEEFQNILKYLSKKFKDQISSGSPDRLEIFHIAARLKRDVKTTWEDIISSIKTKHKKSIEATVKALESKGEKLE